VNTELGPHIGSAYIRGTGNCEVFGTEHKDFFIVQTRSGERYFKNRSVIQWRKSKGLVSK
jgi:hypothetical protein